MDIGQKIYKQQNEDEINELYKRLIESRNGQNNADQRTPTLDAVENYKLFSNGKSPISELMSPTHYVDNYDPSLDYDEHNRLMDINENNKKIERFNKLKTLLNR